MDHIDKEFVADVARQLKEIGPVTLKVDASDVFMILGETETARELRPHKGLWSQKALALRDQLIACLPPEAAAVAVNYGEHAVEVVGDVVNRVCDPSSN